MGAARARVFFSPGATARAQRRHCSCHVEGAMPFTPRANGRDESAPVPQNQRRGHRLGSLSAGILGCVTASE